MNELFAPWRIEWVKRDDRTTTDECVFCRLPEEGTDREVLIVARSDRAYVLLNNAPYNPGHLMVIPHDHTGAPEELSALTTYEVARLTQVAIEAVKATFDPDGLNTGRNLGKSAGGSITEHVHTHVVPRWEGDTNFMAVIDETKVIVQALADCYEQLHETFTCHPASTGLSEAGAVNCSFEPPAA